MLLFRDLRQTWEVAKKIRKQQRGEAENPTLPTDTREGEERKKEKKERKKETEGGMKEALLV